MTCCGWNSNERLPLYGLCVVLLGWEHPLRSITSGSEEEGVFRVVRRRSVVHLSTPLAPQLPKPNKWWGPGRELPDILTRCAPLNRGGDGSSPHPANPSCWLGTSRPHPGSGTGSPRSGGLSLRLPSWMRTRRA